MGRTLEEIQIDLMKVRIDSLETQLEHFRLLEKPNKICPSCGGSGFIKGEEE